jgi:hypothetical protein
MRDRPLGGGSETGQVLDLQTVCYRPAVAHSDGGSLLRFSCLTLAVVMDLPHGQCVSSLTVDREIERK